MQAAAVYVLTAIGIVFTIGVFGMRVAGVPMADQVTTVAEVGAFLGPIVIALLAYVKADKATAKADDNKQAIGVVARTAIDGFAGPPAQKQEAIKALNGTLPAPGSPEAKRPETQGGP
jgi:hypothetical protein